MNQGCISGLAYNILLGIIVNYHQTNSYKAYYQTQMANLMFGQNFENLHWILFLTWLMVAMVRI